MTFWAIIYFSAMMGMQAPDMAAFPDKDECLKAYVNVTPQIVAQFPDLKTTGGCLKIDLKQAPVPKTQVEEKN
jgi:hypothetical protein